MTAKNYEKAYTQLKNKPAKWAKYVKHNKPKERSCGNSRIRCAITGSTRGVIRKYGLKIDRRTFRLNATKLGFKKLD